MKELIRGWGGGMNGREGLGMRSKNGGMTEQCKGVRSNGYATEQVLCLAHQAYFSQ